MQELTYKGITSRSLDILLKHAVIKDDDKLASYLGEHFDELVQHFTPIIRELIDEYFNSPLTAGEPVEWVDPNNLGDSTRDVTCSIQRRTQHK